MTSVQYQIESQTELLGYLHTLYSNYDMLHVCMFGNNTIVQNTEEKQGSKSKFLKRMLGPFGGLAAKIQ
jgi:hypothetical protein